MLDQVLLELAMLDHVPLALAILDQVPLELAMLDQVPLELAMLDQVPSCTLTMLDQVPSPGCPSMPSCSGWSGSRKCAAHTRVRLSIRSVGLSLGVGAMRLTSRTIGGRARTIGGRARTIGGRARCEAREPHSIGGRARRASATCHVEQVHHATTTARAHVPCMSPLACLNAVC